MRVEVKKQTAFRPRQSKYFDLHEEFGLASLLEGNGEVTLYLNDLKCRSWRKGDHPDIWRIKWFDANHAVLDLHGPDIAIVSAGTWKQCQLGYLIELYQSPEFMLAAYCEEQFYRSRLGDLEANLISVFLRDGTFEFGVREIMDNDRDSWKLDDFTAGYTFKDNFYFVAYDSPLLWILNVSERSWKKVPLAVCIVAIDVLTGDDKTAYAIYDNRRLIRNYPELPLFELAGFDLVSETSSKQDFAPVEAALTDAGFVMSEIKFQPNSTGKIIVSDSTKAALLEFSGQAGARLAPETTP